MSPGVISQMNPGPYRPLYLWGLLVGVCQTNRPLPRGGSSRPMVARLVRYGPVRQKTNFSSWLASHPSECRCPGTGGATLTTSVLVDYIASTVLVFDLVSLAGITGTMDDGAAWHLQHGCSGRGLGRCTGRGWQPSLAAWGCSMWVRWWVGNLGLL